MALVGAFFTLIVTSQATGFLHFQGLYKKLRIRRGHFTLISPTQGYAPGKHCVCHIYFRITIVRLISFAATLNYEHAALASKRLTHMTSLGYCCMRCELTATHRHDAI